MICKGKGGISYTLEEKPFAQGGEGQIYSIVGFPDKVAKLYRAGQITPDHERKLVKMTSAPPAQDVLDQIAWPEDVLYSGGQFVGFVMRRFRLSEDLNVIYEYGSSAKYPELRWGNKIRIAMNLCAVLNAVHEAGHVCGDLNPKNISVDPDTGRVTFVDTDSYHITDGAQVYRCCVGMPEYLPREIQAKMRLGLENAPLPTFTEATDNFALAVHIFQLLMNGVHPFACSVIPSADSVVTPDTSDSILNGECPFFTPVAGRDIPRFAPPLDILPDEIRELFRLAFVAGHADPAKRPGAETWYYALERLEGNLTQCPAVIFHEYRSALSACPWCAADQRFRSAVSGAAAKPRLKQTAYAPPITAMAGSVPPAPAAAPVQTAVPMAGGYVGAGSVQQPADNQKHGGFTAGLRRLALLGCALLFVWGGCSIIANPLRGISVVKDTALAAVAYGTPLDQLDLKIKVKRLRSSYEEEVDAGEVAGYDPTVLGAQKLTVTAHGKTCTVKVNVVAVDLATPAVRAENGKLHVEYDKTHTERLILTINGKEYSYADATEDGYLRESITGDSFTVTAQATSSLSGINDSAVSEPVTLRRAAPVTLAGIEDNALTIRAAAGAAQYIVFVDGKAAGTAKTSNGTAVFDIRNVNAVGRHEITAAACGVETLLSVKSASLTYTRLSASLKLDGDKLCWTAVDGATGYLLASGEKKASLDASATEANVMSFYSTTKSARVSLVALGDGKTYIDSPQSAEVNCTFTGEYKTLQNVLDLRKLNGSADSFILLNDIDLAGQAWTPISGFTGSLNGGGFAIKNMTLSSEESNVGFFSVLEGTVSDLRFENARVTATGFKENVGILCGEAKKPISNVSVSGTVTAANCSFVGGIAGKLSVLGDASMENLENRAAVSGKDNVGGIAGYVGGTWSTGGTMKLNAWKNSGAVSGSGSYVGGIAGELHCTPSYGYRETVQMYDSENTGAVSGKTYVGGIFGYAVTNSNASVIERASCRAAVTAEAVAGCIAGKADTVTLNSCTNGGSTLSVTRYLVDNGKKYAYAGGVVGWGFMVNNTVNEVAVRYTSDGAFVGGIAGKLSVLGDASMENLENRAAVSGKDNVGGIAGYVGGTGSIGGTMKLNAWKNSGAVSGSGSYVGGIAGELHCTPSYGYRETVQMYDSENTGAVSGKTYVGGIFGYAVTNSKDSLLMDCSSTSGVLMGYSENITVQ